MKDICLCNKKLVKEVEQFIRHVGDVKEESITDYLMWKWKEFDPRFKCIKTKTHTRQEEHHKTGADFDLELWILSNTKKVSLAVQAKKFIKRHDSYVSKIKYPNGSSQQINKLLEYSKDYNKIPVYFLYSTPNKAKTRCKDHSENSGVFVVPANEMKNFSYLGKGEKLSLDTILNKSHSLSCYFCHEKGTVSEIFDYLGLNGGKDIEVFYEDQEIPDYVTDILGGGISNINLPKVFRWVGVYDLRE